MPRRAEPPRVFLLSPAHLGGKRAAILLRDEAAFPLAVRLRGPGGVPLGEAFSFLSGLYFRGKLAYAARFARPPMGVAGVQVITANRGLVAAEAPVGPTELRDFGSVDIRSGDPRYRGPLVRDVSRLAEHPGLELVLLGSLATGKYVDVLLDVVGERLLFPTDFAGRGDMSRGALLLRSAREGRELSYESVAGALGRLRPRTRGAANDGDPKRPTDDADPHGRE
ncbi:MAG TPA: hypothetical protein VG500_09260 [Gemmatimonadales bacterium]|jgi:hypothetical protein|nr:hypothetical protein [Gemmatimonadales bacterium]